MPPADSSDNNRRANHSDHEHNPFVSFRHFVDNQIESLLGVKFWDQPSATNGLPQSHDRKMWQHKQADRREAVDAAKGPVGDPFAGFRDPGLLDEMKERQLVEQRRKELEHVFERWGFAPWGQARQIHDEMQKEWEAVASGQAQQSGDNKDRQPKVWHRQWSWRWPPEHQSGANSKDVADGTEDVQPAAAQEKGDFFTEIDAVLQEEAERLRDMFGLSHWLPNTDAFPDPEVQWRNPQDYAALSDYSPIRLEKDPSFRNAGTLWRQAFEDLVRADMGQEVKGPQSDSTLPSKSLNDWVLGLSRQPFGTVVDRETEDTPGQPQRRCRRFGQRCEELAKQPHGASETYAAHQSDVDAHDAPPEHLTHLPDTEQELYERFFGISPERAANKPLNTAKADVSTTSRPSVLSTLTTTEQTTLPDGSITTKVVLKKRFADGREEKSESVHTSRGEPAHQALGQTVQQQQQQPKKSWFWA